MTRQGPIDDFTCSDTYAARVLSPEGRALHGYDIESDLAANYSFPELVLTALTGSPPDASVGEAFGRVLSFLAVIEPGEAPCHAAGLSRLIGAHSGAMVTTGCLGLAERARRIVMIHQPLLEWLEHQTGPYPRLRESGEDDRDSVERLRAVLAPTSVHPSNFQHDPTRTEALIGVLHACGLRHPDQFVTVWVLGALASVVAEAAVVMPRDFASYPLRLPEFDYIGGGNDG